MLDTASSPPGVDTVLTRVRRGAPWPILHGICNSLLSADTRSPPLPMVRRLQELILDRVFLNLVCHERRELLGCVDVRYVLEVAFGENDVDFLE